MRCIAHEITLAVKDRVTIVHENITEIWTILTAIRSLVKHSDLQQNIQNKPRLTVPLPSLNVLTRWSSIFLMIRNAHKSHAILDTIATRHSNMHSFSVFKTYWNTAVSIGTFLQNAASLTECQLASSYATLGMTVKTFKALTTKCQSVIDANNVIIKPVAEKCSPSFLSMTHNFSKTFLDLQLY